MKEIIAVSNQKGGVGKSTTANAIGAYLHHQGFKVLYVDMDAQGNLSYSLGVTRAALSSLEVLTQTATAEEVIVTTEQGDLLPASPSLASADLLLKDTGREYRLKEALEPLYNHYDYIVIDTPPAIGILTVNALAACNSVLVPAQADVFSLQGIGQLVQTIQTVKKYCNHSLTIKGLLVTRFNSRAVLTRDMTQLLQDTADKLETTLFQTKIRECISLKEAQVSQKDIFTYAPKSNAAKDYGAFMVEMMEVFNLDRK